MKTTYWWLLTFAWAYLIWYLTGIPNLKLSHDSLLNYLISASSHFSFFGVQAILVFFSTRNKNWSIMLTSLYGVLDELRQIQIPGRTADPVDWALDTLGAIIFLAITKKILNQKFSNSPI